ncbi:hypothetical protein [Nakamurella endophytica]|uniref:hypothetical protein n=1 Tax=Nakamurella endophytica TaxID=1748367 RepID=UPI00166CAEB6|nr:hypothetical protein [Nakamurella endophytica]
MTSSTAGTTGPSTPRWRRRLIGAALTAAVVAATSAFSACAAAQDVAQDAGAAAAAVDHAAGITDAAAAAPTPTATPVAAAAGGRGPVSRGSAGRTSAGSPVSVPLHVRTVTPEEIPVVVEITVGGGRPIPVMLDTGSSGLLVDGDAVGPGTVRGGTPYTSEYVSGNLVGTLGSATVGIGGVPTTHPIAIAVVDRARSTFTLPAGVDGIMGIGTTDTTGFAGQVLFAPQLQLPAPYNAGSTIRIDADATGTWTLGPVPPRPGDAVVPMPAAAPAGAHLPAGYPQVARDVDLCWRVAGAAAACGLTAVDSGSWTALLSTAAYSGLAAPGHLVAPGHQVTVSAPSGASLWSWTSGERSATNTVAVATLAAGERFNTGIGLFVGRTIAWDYAGAQVRIGSAG